MTMTEHPHFDPIARSLTGVGARSLIRPAAVLDYQVDLIRWWQGDVGVRYAKHWVSDPYRGTFIPGVSADVAARQIAHREADSLDRSASYWISADMMQLVQAAADKLPDLPMRPEHLPSPRGFIVFDKPLWVYDAWGKKMSTRAIRWADSKNCVRASRGSDEHEPGVEIVSYSHLDDLGLPDADDYEQVEGAEALRTKLIMNHATGIGYGWDWWNTDEMERPEPRFDREGNEIVPETQGSVASHRWLLTCWLLMQQRVINLGKVRPDRAQARRLDRLGNLNVEREVNVVTLRKEQARPKDYEHEPVAVDWTHRWMVDGHWRNQWYPSEGVHRPIFIAPFIKGPEDRPLVLRDKVYKWTR